MIVADLHKYLSSLSDALSSSGAAKVAGELNTVAGGLRPFHAMSLKEFAAFLEFAEEVKQKGYPPPKQPKAPPKPKPAKVPVPTVQEAITMFKGLYDRALSPTVTEELVKAEAVKLEPMKKADLEKVAKGVGLQQKFKTKADIIATLEKRILDRKGMDERAPL